ncbi:MAG: SDR family NAD(P)-dependent oxidoreductase [Deltaproteobacteria bacterium]|jgi:NAD(P)-dependent dehydrogenase (short-subunit alcohol dehydrogenase family)
MTDMSLDLSGKSALVTGGSRGLGKAIAGTFAAHGARVAICSRKQENLDKAVQDFQASGHTVSAHVANVGKPDQVNRLFQTIDAEFEKLDILVNNVGMNILTPSVTATDPALWDKIIETNLKGTFLTSSGAVGLMKKAGKGKIINISSIAARRAAMGMGIYCVAKAGVEMLTKVLAIELVGDHITVNGIAPCVVRTDFTKPFWSNESTLKEIVRTIPMGRMAETEDIVGTALYLASDLSDFVTGEIITVDGGSMA